MTLLLFVTLANLVLGLLNLWLGSTTGNGAGYFCAGLNLGFVPIGVIFLLRGLS